MTNEIQILPAGTDELKNAIYRLRYEIYIDELKKFRDIANNEQQLFSEPEDTQSRMIYASENNKVIATSRCTLGSDNPLPPRMIDQYSLNLFLNELPQAAIAIIEHTLIARDFRSIDLFFTLYANWMHLCNELRVQLVFTSCNPQMLNWFQGLGFRTYSKTNVHQQRGDFLIPLVLVVEDIHFLQHIHSPLLEFLHDFENDNHIPNCLDKIIAEGSAVKSYELTSPTRYWGEVYNSLNKVAGLHIAAFDDFNAGEMAACLAKSNIITCQAGDHLVVKNSKSENLFVVLEGTLEVRDGDTVIAVFTPGDVFGEMAFLLKQARSKDIYAVTNGTKVLSLNETMLQQLIRTEPAIAAKLLMNIAKMLCLRILKTTTI